MNAEPSVVGCGKKLSECPPAVTEWGLQCVHCPAPRPMDTAPPTRPDPVSEHLAALGKRGMVA
jgi:hypothetical protein